MSSPALQILSANPGASVQDLGRPGWKRFGLPPGGAMDGDSFRMANLLVGNSPHAPAVEFLMGNLHLRALRPVLLAVTGARLDMSHPQWRSFSLEAGEDFLVRRCHAGLWAYLAIAGGFDAPLYFGSASVNARALLGSLLQPGLSLSTGDTASHPSVASRFLPANDLPRFAETSLFPVWKGPEWELLSPSAREAFCSTIWRVSPHSDRSGYRLEGSSLLDGSAQILSAPLSVGVVQLPPAGQPIVIMRDGPTVGGYPRLAILDPSVISRFSQSAPGSGVRFRLIE